MPGSLTRDRHPLQRGREDGFTLIELMVVILIIGILIAIALPTYVGARTRANDRAAQSDLRTALAAAMTHWAEVGSFTGFDVTQARATEPSLAWIPAGPPARGQVVIEVASGGNLLLTGLSGSGTYYCIAQLPGSPVTSTGGDPTYANVDELAECTGGW